MKPQLDPVEHCLACEKQIKELRIGYCSDCEMTSWFYVKTTDDPKIVGEVVCSFNFEQGEHPQDQYSWILQPGRDEPGYWEIRGKYAVLKDLTEIGIVYRIGDTVVFAEIEDYLAPDFLDPLITKYGFDYVKWIVVPGKR